MVLKTFNLNEETYKKFSEFCREHGISMSKQINMFIESQITEEPELRESYLKKLESIRRGKYIKFNSIDELRKATS
jgi:antitoxin component of RelBE/YafQ-DinJ toxin-antitoxin module